MNESMFPDPPKPPKPRHRRRAKPDDACCMEWLEYVDERAQRGRKVTRVEATVHRFGHSRTPFSRALVRELTGCSDFIASSVIGVAQRHQWIVPVGRYGPGPELYVGVL